MNGAVLIVDDSLTVRMNLFETFEAAGIAAEICASLAEARSTLSKAEFSILILDVLLPDGDGIDFMKEVRAMPHGAEMIVMLLSNESDVLDRVRGISLGADDYLGKPYDPAYVVARTREFLRNKQPVLASAQETVLIIDDSPTFREALKLVLEAAFFTVHVAGNGDEGLRIAADLRPTAIIVDGILPGIDGPTVIRRIRLDAALRQTPCLMLTASEEVGAEIIALEAGADAFVKKSDDAEIILAKLTAMLRSSGASAGDRATASLLAPKKILTVDDSETHLQRLAEILRGDGYEVVLARSGEEALRLLAVQSVDCILLDWLMPGIGGRETCRRIKASPSTRDIPTILLTSQEDRETMIQGLGAGADDYIAKSGDFDVLRARVLAQLRRKQFEDENRSMREQLLRRELEIFEARAAQELSETKAMLVDELEQKNKELEAFSYSVSHDLRAPLRSIDGFSQALLEEYSTVLDDTGHRYLTRVRHAAQRMGELIDDILQLSKISRSALQRRPVDLSALAQSVVAELARTTPERHFKIVIPEKIMVDGDQGLLRIVFENLLGNAWKFTGGIENPVIEFGSRIQNDDTVYFIRDNGAGFDMAYAEKLFMPFQRLHTEADFPGTGIGLATVQRIIARHNGRIWAESMPQEGAVFLWTLWATRSGDTS